MIIVNPTTGNEVKNKKFNPFVDLVIQYLYDNHQSDFLRLIQVDKNNCSIDYGPARMTSVFYHNIAGKHKPWPRKYSFKGIHGDFYLCKDWNALKPRKDNSNRDFNHLKEMIDLIFPKYELITDPDGFKLVDKAGDTSTIALPDSKAPHPSRIVEMTTSESLIRVDYSYLSRFIHGKGVAAWCFNTSAFMMASAGNVSLLSLMDRIPVYVVDSKFMEKHFDSDGNRFNGKVLRCVIIMKEIITLLEQLLLVIMRDISIDNINSNVKQINSHIRFIKRFIDRWHLLELAPWLRILSEVERCMRSIEEFGCESAVGNPDIIEMLENLISELKCILSNYDRMPPVEYLGVYCPEWKKYSEDGESFHYERAIFICGERILDCAETGRTEDLLTKVTIHEFSHAYMDIITGNIKKSNPDYHWMEESMANVMTLCVTEKYVVKHPSKVPTLNYFKEFMKKQPDAYASAVTMWENGICDYDLWSWNKDACLAATSVRKWCSEMRINYRSIDPNKIRCLWSDVRKEILGL